MPFQQPGWSKSRAELLMDITAGLANLTQRPEDVSRVPAYLSQRLELEPLTLALLREQATGPQIVLSASSGALANDQELLHEVIAGYLKRRQQSGREDSIVRPSGESSPAESAITMDVSHHQLPRATIFTQRVDVGFQMMLIVHHWAADEPLNCGLIESLHAITKQIAKFLAGIAIWLYRPAGMGAPFDRLTHREWMVLRGLSTAACEKELADQLKLSPHTLHSHIKSIYRKTGAPGRLPLLLSAQEALREIRCQGINGYGARKAVNEAVGTEKTSEKSALNYS